MSIKLAPLPPKDGHPKSPFNPPHFLGQTLVGSLCSVGGVTYLSFRVGFFI